MLVLVLVSCHIFPNYTEGSDMVHIREVVAYAGCSNLNIHKKEQEEKKTCRAGSVVELSLSVHISQFPLNLLHPANTYTY